MDTPPPAARRGLLFAVVLMLVERHRTFESLSLGRAAALGAAGSLALPALFMVFGRGPMSTNWPIAISLFGAFGAVCASATLALARRPQSEPER